jgi:hypothetical protein
MGASERLYHSQGRECGFGGLPDNRSGEPTTVRDYFVDSYLRAFASDRELLGRFDAHFGATAGSAQ